MIVKKRFMALVMALVMAFTMAPFGLAYAASEETEPGKLLRKHRTNSQISI